MTLRLIGAGFGRTGTLSLKSAIETLGGGPCYHMLEVASHPGHASLWHSAADEPDRFLDRVRVFTMPGTNIFSIARRIEYGLHWKKEREAIEQLLKADGALGVMGEADFKNWRHIQEFSYNVNEMLAHIADVLQARDFDQYVQAAIDELTA